MTLIIILAIVLLILGAAGTVFPALPGLPLMFGGAWLLAYTSDYQIIGSFSVLILGVVCALGMAMDFVAGVLGAKYTGASKEALWGAFFGGLAGIFLGLAGLVLGPLVGAAIGELLAKRDILLAGKVGIGTFVGFIVGTVAKIGAALVVLLVVLAQYVAHWLA
ncbi:DUF456 domain-containing protein [Alysiella filiformis]|uniref:DUF456 domain-containing protein n=1 Tax=Alysiella filiformis DSM 16848 TaxID=1120981 RepID=A0A286EL60_9NEIS|nr:DUF456 family protein [Alysiella filiformis]QMT30978.1 DUF456 family protein [Alysiella filiformis]UBQ56035.1 DUF456 family protein [Alysiella filiformis DSM 16848]SOD71646.1 hypothetical protein SAMN02746062_02162 [Alysiella filiformis DSM 16848]